MKRSFLLLIFAALTLAAWERVIDISPRDTLKGDISGNQDADFVDNVKALRMGDKLVIKTSSTTALTGTVSYCYMDVNFVEVRAGFLDDRLGHFRMTWDDDAMMGRVYDALKPESYDLLKRFGRHPLNIDCMDVAAFKKKYPLKCGVNEGDAEIHASAVDQKDDPKIWDDDVMTTQTFLVIYTKNASKKYAERGGINNLIAQGLALGNLSLENSGVPTRLVLAHSEAVDYVSTGNGSTDLSAFGSNRGPFSNVKYLQCHYGADVRSIVPENSNYGGLAYVASTASGISDRDPAHMINVDYMSWHSWIHEIGHNMGGQHAIEQSYSAGPSNGGLFGHSVGSFYTLRGDDSYGSIMAYAGHRTDNFSDTNAFIESVPLGVDGRRNVARTWKKIRKYAANYHALAKPSRILAEESFLYKLDDSLMWQEGGTGWFEPWWTCSNKVYQICGGLSYPGLHSSGSAVMMDAWTSNAIWRCGGDYERRVPFNKGGKSTFWFSCLVSRQNDDDNYFGVGLGSRIRIAKNAGTDLIYLNSAATGRALEPFSTNLFVAKVDLYLNKVYFWMDPALDAEPQPDSADANVAYNMTGIASNRVVIEGRKGAKFIVDEVRLGKSWEDVLIKQHPQDPLLEERENSLCFSFLAAAGEYDVYRSETKDFSGRTYLNTVSTEGGRVVLDDDTAETGKVYYYMAAPTDSAEERLFTMPVSGLLGNLNQSADAGGPYVVGQGETNYFDASASKGWMPAFRWQLRGVQSQMKTNNMVYAYTDTYEPGTYDVTLIMRDRRRPYDGVVTNYTTLTITNSYPKLNVALINGSLMAGRPLTFQAFPSDPGTNDTFLVRWRPEVDGEWTEWTSGLYFVHQYQTSGEKVLKCQVRDNYGAVTEKDLDLALAEARSIPSFPTNVIVPAGSDRVGLEMKNFGTLPYDYSVAVPEEQPLSVGPISGSVGPDGRTLLVKVDPAALGKAAEYRFTLTADGKEEIVNVRTLSSDAYPLLAQSGNFTLNEGDVLRLNNFGSTPGYSYKWLLDGEEAAEGGVSEIVSGTDGGTHVLTLAAYDGENRLAGSLETNVFVNPLVSRVYLEEVSRTERSVRLRPVLAPYKEGTSIRFNWDEDMGWTTWQAVTPDSEFEHEFSGGGDRHIHCEINQRGSVNGSSFMFRPEFKFDPKPKINGSEDAFITLSAGESIEFEGDATLGNYWREDPMNPDVGLIADKLAAVTACGPFEKAGTYYFAYYAGNGEAISAPKVLTVEVGLPSRELVSWDLNGTVTTNTMFGSGPLGGCALAVSTGNEIYWITNSAYGSFSFPSFSGGDALTLNITHPDHSPCLTNINANTGCAFALERSSSFGYLYFNCVGERSNLPLEGVAITVAGQKVFTNSKGRSAALALPLGDYLAELNYPGMDRVITNATVGSKPATISVAMKGRQYALSGIAYGTGNEIVTNAQLQVLSKETMNIAKRYNLDGAPFYDVILGETLTTLRFRPYAYDNLNIDIQLENNWHKDTVLTPEPLLAPLLLFAIGLIYLRNKKR
ncbi:hypothetical protein J6X96_04290 [bacterium]|nr:hypothetical protein [bacterium]